MHFAFLTIPSSGEFNVQLATANELVKSGNKVTFLSGKELGKHVDTLRKSQLDPISAHFVNFIPLGQHKSVTDFSPTVRNRLSQMRRKPGDIRSLQACIDIGFPSWEDFHATAVDVSETLEALDPDMVVVDALSPAMITGVRLTGRAFYLTIPCSPGLTASSKISSPHAASENRDGLSSVIESSYLRLRDYLYCIQKPFYLSKSRKLKNQLSLKSFGLRQNVTLLPPYWKDENCLGGIHFNVPGLNDCPQQPSSITFVGAGITPLEPKVDNLSIRTETEQWLDESYSMDQHVVFVNMGSMFVWSEKEFNRMISAFEIVHNHYQGSVRFLFKASLKNGHAALTEKQSQFIRLSNWIEDQNAVYQHPALKVFIHHGGGNSFNEAVYYGIPQLIIGQWLDHHEYGFLVERFNMGLRCKKAPLIDSRSISTCLLKMLGPEWKQMKQSSVQWSIRSQLAGGPKVAAKLLIMNTKRPSISSFSSGLSTPHTLLGETAEKSSLSKF